MVKVLSQLYRPFTDVLGGLMHTMDPGLTFVLKTYIGPGSATVVIHGDGDPRLEVLIIYDDKVRVLPSTEARLINISYNSMLRIAIRNPGKETVTARSPTIETTGVMQG